MSCSDVGTPESECLDDNRAPPIDFLTWVKENDLRITLDHDGPNRVQATLYDPTPGTVLLHLWTFPSSEGGDHRDLVRGCGETKSEALRELSERYVGRVVVRARRAKRGGLFGFLGFEKTVEQILPIPRMVYRRVGEE